MTLIRQGAWTDLHQQAWSCLIANLNPLNIIHDYQGMKVEIWHEPESDRYIVTVTLNGAVIKDDFNDFPSEETIAKVRLLGL